ncbi:uncharacterized protein LOC126733645 [Anthonomus grandis grandis]|uniref:uncharacterized protein LOC126733645 n=1 Tax=Anthonomus grandis grandis TaxID=2921223 RepID=UPI0021650D1F|nr:uncharacterized protein LOC126733645 [Anthonomus grandis grandis]
MLWLKISSLLISKKAYLNFSFPVHFAVNKMNLLASVLLGTVGSSIISILPLCYLLFLDNVNCLDANTLTDNGKELVYKRQIEENSLELTSVEKFVHKLEIWRELHPAKGRKRRHVNKFESRPSNPLLNTGDGNILDKDDKTKGFQKFGEKEALIEKMKKRKRKPVGSRKPLPQSLLKI